MWRMALLTAGCDIPSSRAAAIVVWQRMVARRISNCRKVNPWAPYKLAEWNHPISYSESD
jgi:hypothetical protein